MKIKITARIAFLWALVLLLTTCRSGGESEQGQAQPNILLIVADGLGYEKLVSYNSLISNTPNLDRLAEQGVLFKRAYASPVCTPSRMSIYTGTYASTHRYTNVIPVHEGSREAVDFEKWTTYARLLRENGYLTAVTGKWQMGGLGFHPDHCASAGFDSWCVWQIWHQGKKTKRYWQPTLNEDGKIRTDVDTLFGPDILTDYVIRQMRAAKQKGKPFMIQHNMMLPHVPVVQTPEDRRLGREARLDNMISYMDSLVGELLAALKKLELEKNTVVIFVGDNGTQSKEPRITDKGLVEGGKWTLKDGGMHVPLIVSFPDNIKPRNIEDLIDISDLFPTLCDLSGTGLSDSLSIDGISFYDLLMNRGAGKRKWVTAGYKDDFIIFDGNWRFHTKDDILVDCRNLQDEKEADMNSKQAKEAFTRLKSILDTKQNL